MRPALGLAIVIVGLGVVAATPKPMPTTWSSAATETASAPAPVVEPQAVWIPPAEAPGSGWRLTLANGASYHLSPCDGCQNQPAWIHILRDGNGQPLRSSISLELIGDEFRVYAGSHAPHGKSGGMWHLPRTMFNLSGPNTLVNDGVLGDVIVTPE